MKVQENNNHQKSRRNSWKRREGGGCCRCFGTDFVPLRSVCSQCSSFFSSSVSVRNLAKLKYEEFLLSGFRVPVPLIGTRQKP